MSMHPSYDEAHEPKAFTPIYRKVAHDEGWATDLWFIVCNEGWRQSIVCERCYEWVADWLLDVLASRPYPARPTP